MSGFEIVSTLKMPEWVLGNPVTPDGYATEPDRIYLYHNRSPRFILAYHFVEPEETDLDGALELELSGELLWLDAEPPAREMAILLGRADRVRGACEEQDRRTVGE